MEACIDIGNIVSQLKCHYDENHIFSIEAILKHKQVACMRRKMLFTIFKYLFLVFTKSVDSNFHVFWLASVTWNILGY